MSRSDRIVSRRPDDDHQARAELEERILDALAAGDAERVSQLRERLEAEHG
jgi:hypothetical protein